MLPQARQQSNGTRQTNGPPKGLMEQKNIASFDGVRYSLDYETAIDQLYNGTLDRTQNTHLLILDHTPQLYIDRANAQDLKIITGWDIAYLAMNKEGENPGNYHSLGPDIMKMIPKAIQNPLYIVKEKFSVDDTEPDYRFSAADEQGSGYIDGPEINQQEAVELRKREEAEYGEVKEKLASGELKPREQLTTKAKNHLQKAERSLLNRIRYALSVPRVAAREHLRVPWSSCRQNSWRREGSPRRR